MTREEAERVARRIRLGSKLGDEYAQAWCAGPDPNSWGVLVTWPSGAHEPLRSLRAAQDFCARVGIGPVKP